MDLGLAISFPFSSLYFLTLFFSLSIFLSPASFFLVSSLSSTSAYSGFPARKERPTGAFIPPTYFLVLVCICASDLCVWCWSCWNLFFFLYLFFFLVFLFVSSEHIFSPWLLPCEKFLSFSSPSFPISLLSLFTFFCDLSSFFLYLGLLFLHSRVFSLSFFPFLYCIVIVIFGFYFKSLGYLDPMLDPPFQFFISYFLSGTACICLLCALMGSSMLFHSDFCSKYYFGYFPVIENMKFSFSLPSLYWNPVWQLRSHSGFPLLIIWTPPETWLSYLVCFLLFYSESLLSSLTLLSISSSTLFLLAFLFFFFLFCFFVFCLGDRSVLFCLL